MKKILDKMILIVIIYIVLFIASYEILRQFSLYFREWVYIFSIIFIVIGFSVGVYYKISKAKTKKKKVIFSVIYTLMLIVLLGNPYTILVVALSYQPEHIVEKDNQKLVAYVSGFLDTYVYYYEYKNPFIIGNKVMEEWYGNGGFDPIENSRGYEYEVVSTTYYDKDGKVIKENEHNNKYDATSETTQNSSDEYNHVDDVSKILNNPGLNIDLRNRKEKIIQDEQNYGNRYMKFTNFELYSRKPDRIIFKQGDKDGFYIFEQSDKAYEHLLVVSEDRMAYSVMQDYNLWCFTPDSIDTMTKSGDNYIIYDFDNTDLTEYDEGFQKDVIFRFNTENRLYRLVSYLAEFKEIVTKENVGKSEFASNTEISGYDYMMNYGREWYDD